MDRRVHFPGDAASPGLARRFVRSALHEAGLDALADDALLLTSELCENAVLHAGTGFELEVTGDANSVTITVTDHGSTAMELRRGTPSDRQATHNRGLQIVDTLAAAWGSRHDGSSHQIWFTLRLSPLAEEPNVPLGQSDVEWPAASTAKWLLFIPTPETLTLELVATELVRRLCDVLLAAGANVYVNYGGGDEELAAYGKPDGSGMITMALPLFGPRTGRLCVYAPPAPGAVELTELTARRLALAVEYDWVRGAARERRTWLTYLAEASELLTHSLDVRLTTTMVPQLVVPRLGGWCAVHLLDERRQLQVGALTHQDEAVIPRLRADLSTGAHALLLRLLSGGGDATGLPSPVDGVAVPLRIGDKILGTLSVGRLPDRAHGPEEIMMITELSRRAAQAIDNAQRNAAHVATAQALQQALLPRALPIADGVRFAASYQPTGTGTDVGGDFYDVVAIAEGRWLAAIGDVCGKGARAASRTSLVRDVLRVLVRQDLPLVRALALLHEMMMEAADPDQFATVAVALITRVPDGLDVELVLAGHEQPVLVRPDHTAVLVGRHGNAVGLVSPFQVHPTQHTLHPGDTLVFYTDGITERRHADDQFGTDRLLQTLASATPTTPDQLILDLQRAAQDFSPEPHQDDIAIMAIQAPIQ